MTRKSKFTLSARYKFILNPHQEARFTKCPNCERKTRIRKIPLAVHVDPISLVMLNKECRYCPDCDILIIHQDELENALVYTFKDTSPELIGNEYLVMGTFGKSTWRNREKSPLISNMLDEKMHPFKDRLEIEHTPAHWGPTDEEILPPKKTPTSEEVPHPTIDDQNEVSKLTAKIKKHLPILAELDRKETRYLLTQGFPVPPHRMLKIYDTFDLKDEGGIGCVISPKGSREVTVISLTHLKIHNRHPLFKEIRAYQKKRKKELKKRGSISGYTEITP